VKVSRRIVALAIVLGAAAIVAACVRAATSRRAETTPKPPTTSLVDASASIRGDELPDLDALAARGATDAPLMREVLRTADATTGAILAAGASDACFRAVIASSAPVQARFEDSAGAIRGAPLSGAPGMVPPRGPACARRGETLRLVVELADHAARARAIVWQSP